MFFLNTLRRGISRLRSLRLLLGLSIPFGSSAGDPVPRYLDLSDTSGVTALTANGQAFTFSKQSGTRLQITGAPALPRGTYDLVVVRYGVFTQVVDSYRSIPMNAWYKAGLGETKTGSLLNRADDLSGNNRHLIFSAGLEPTALDNDGTTMNASPAWDFAGGKYTTISWGISTASPHAWVGHGRQALGGVYGQILQGTGGYYYMGVLASQLYGNGVNDLVPLPVYENQGIAMSVVFNGTNSFVRTEGYAGAASDCGTYGSATLYVGGRTQHWNSILHELICCQNPADEAWLHAQMRSQYGSHTVGYQTEVAGSYGVTGFVNGVASAARFSLPTFLEWDAKRAVLLITDDTNCAIRSYNPATGAVDTVAGNGTSGTADGVAGNARFNRPADIIRLDEDNFLVADWYNGCVRKLDRTTNTVTTYVGLAGAPDHVDGPAASARLFQPFGLALDGGLLYICQLNGTIRRYNPTNVTINGLPPGYVDTWLGAPNTYGTTDGVGTAARFSTTPYNIAFTSTPAGRVGWITDRTNFLLRRVAVATATVSTVCGLAGALGHVNGVGTDVRWNGHDGIKAINDRTLVLVDSSANCARRIDLYGDNYDRIVVSDIIGGPPTGGVNGYGGAARDYHTVGLAYVPSLGKLFMTNNYGHVLEAIDWSP